ncbi:hypothetical protein F5Y13DRAFT_181195 [Hypoxylon sp. FL1857]|nr:hypothetical protein F5Y13DRAFT_181195 [Hypoxylon sp. FL1857]
MSHICSSERNLSSANCFSCQLALDVGCKQNSLVATTVKIHSTSNQAAIPTLPFISALPPQEELNSNEAIPSYTSSLNTATIPAQDFSVFTTDSQQSTWLPSSSPSQPAQPAQSNFLPPQQDFVLFDQPPTPQRQNVNRTVSSPASHAAAFGSLNANTRSSPHLTTGSASPSVQNQRVAQIIRQTGHQTSPSTAFTNRYNSQAQLYTALSSLSPPTAAGQQNRRPPVPLFTQGNSNQQSQTKMDLQDAIGFEDPSVFQGGVLSSPGVPSYDVNMSSTPSSVSNLATVSPHELFLDPFASAPNSAAITHLTSPSLYGDSPEFLDSFETSPYAGVNELNGEDMFPPLFSAQEAQVPNNTLTDNDLSPPQQSEDLEVTETSSKPRRKSGNSPTASGHGKHSSVSGVNASRRRKELPPIYVDDPHDTVAMKRARNTLAARKSRERKAQRFEELEAKIEKLTKERDYWKSRCEALSQSG